MKRRVLTEEERKARKKESTRISDKKRRSAPEYKEKQKVHNQTYYKKNPEKHRKKNETYYDNNRPALILYAKNKRAKVKATKGPNEFDPPEGMVEDYYDFMNIARWKIQDEFPHYTVKETYKAVFQSWIEYNQISSPKVENKNKEWASHTALYESRGLYSKAPDLLAF